MFEGGYFNLNDIPELTEHTRTAKRELAQIDYLTAERRVGDAVRAWAKIQDAARQAGWLLQRLHGDKP